MKRAISNLQYNKSKRDCFERYAESGGSPCGGGLDPLGNKALPGLVSFASKLCRRPDFHRCDDSGMDSFKEANVAMYGDPLLNRGFGVLAVDGPGQYEYPLLGIYMTVENWEATGRACMDWLIAPAGSRPSARRYKRTQFRLLWDDHRGIQRTAPSSRPSRAQPASNQDSTRSLKKPPPRSRCGSCSWRISATRRLSTNLRRR